MGPGTLYGSVKRLLQQGLIAEADERTDSALGDERRRYYRLSEAGRATLKAELQRFASALSVASDRSLVSSTVWRRAKSTLA